MKHINTRYCENTGILTLLWSTYGYFQIVRTCKSTYDISGICTPTRHTGHTHSLHITYTIDQHSLRAYFTRPIYTTCTIFTKRNLRAYNLRPHLRAQSMPENYVYNLRAQLTRTTYILVWRAHVTIDASELHVQPTCLTCACNLHLSLTRTYYTMWFGAHVFIIRISTQ